MTKLISLLRATMSDNMNIFRIKSKNQSGISKKILPIFLAFVLMFAIGSYAQMMIEELTKYKLEYVVLTIFAFATCILTLVEGIYKCPTMLFNCKDDNMLLSLPISKTTVLFVRVLKFYVFEIMYNSLFLIPAMVVYATYVKVGVTYYIACLLALLFLPVVPIIISCIIGGIISASSSKFRYKNLAQIVISMVFLVIIFFASYQMQNIMANIASKATDINDFITRLYYPIGAFIKMTTDFDIVGVLIFVVVHCLVFALAICALSRVYFSINSSTKGVKTKSTSKHGTTHFAIRTSSPMKALIRKEFKKFITSPVFVINAAFGLVLFVVACVGMAIKLNELLKSVIEADPEFDISIINSYIPVVLLGLICFASLMSSITSSMISLEGKTFNILKSLPVKSRTIILAKVWTAVLVMIPALLVGDLIVFIKFKFDLVQIILISIASIVLPFVAELIGIIINIKYPKLNAENDTEVVKQSMSSMVAVFTGMGMLALTGVALFKCVDAQMKPTIILLAAVSVYTIIMIVLLLYLNYKSVKEFEHIQV